MSDSNATELISVVVPIYNVEKYLLRCIDSILMQTYDNLQIILVDDGSPDGSPGICEEYAKFDPRIEVIHKQNGGLSDARNAGIERAKGMYIAFIDSDDYVHKNYIENMYSRIKRDNSDMCVCSFGNVEENKEDLDAVTAEPEKYSFCEEGVYAAETIFKMMAAHESVYFVVAWNKLYRRKLFNNIKYPVDRLHEDEFVFHHLIFACSAVSIISDMLYFYFQRTASIMSKPYSVKRLDALDAYDDRVCFYIENKFYDILKDAFINYIKWYTRAYTHLDKKPKENRLCWKRCSKKFRIHLKEVFKFCGFATGLRFLTAILSPKVYNAIYKLKNPKMRITKTIDEKNIKIGLKARIKKSLKKILPYHAQVMLKYNPVRRNKLKKAWDIKNGGYYRDAVKSGSCVFLLNTPEHTNLGDNAIAAAEISYLNDIIKNGGSTKSIIEVRALSKNIFSLDILQNIIPKNDVLIVHGGGYIGTDWFEENDMFLRIISLFPENRIILMPQSIFYSSGKEGEHALKRSKRIYARHKDLHLFMRDKISYDLAKRYHPETAVYLCPDIVLSMKHKKTESEREGVLLCMRNDIEKMLNDNDAVIIEKICEKYGHIERTDMIIEGESVISADIRSAFIDAKLERFGRAKLIVTDRLHGMIFAVLAGTPCVALSNHNHKIKGLYGWIKDLKYIKYIDGINELEKAVESVLGNGPGCFDRDLYLPYFSELEKLLLEK